MLRLIIPIVILLGFLASISRIAQKLGLYWFEGAMPFYNIFAIARAVDQDSLGVATIVTAVAPMLILAELEGVFVAVSMLLWMAAMVLWSLIQYKVLLALGKPEWWVFLSLLLPVVYYPLLALSKD